MKLIIEIPKSEYTEIKRYYDSLPEYSTVEAETYYIAHGTPFDDVRAEIENATTLHMGMVGYVEAEKVIDILDNIGKAESEDT